MGDQTACSARRKQAWAAEFTAVNEDARACLQRRSVRWLDALLLEGHFEAGRQLHAGGYARHFVLTIGFDLTHGIINSRGDQVFEDFLVFLHLLHFFLHLLGLFHQTGHATFHHGITSIHCGLYLCAAALRHTLFRLNLRWERLRPRLHQPAQYSQRESSRQTVAAAVESVGQHGSRLRPEPDAHPVGVPLPARGFPAQACTVGYPN